MNIKMRRYIDADELKESFEYTEDAEYCRWTLAGVLGKIDDMPTADVVEVLHGRWIKNDGRYGWHCSVCGEDDLYAFAWNSDTGENELQDHYCPNCGASMVNEDE